MMSAQTSIKLLHFRLIFYPFLAFLFGIVIARKLFMADVFTIVLVVLVFCALATGLFLFGKYKSLIILMVFFLLGNGAYFLSYHLYMGKAYEGECVVIGRVTDDVVDYGYMKRLVLDDVYINGEKTKNLSLMISGETDDFIKEGDKITFSSEVEQVHLFKTGSFQSFYTRSGVSYEAQIKASQATVIDQYVKFDESFRSKIKKMLHENMSAENAAVCYAVLFGDKSDIVAGTKNIYRNAGVIHILTVSGLHVGFLITLIYWLLKKCRLNRLWTTLIASIFLLIYNLLCGFAPSVMRASIMAVVIMLARLSGKEYDNLNSLGVAGFIILLLNPLTGYDAGFLMSFFCVASIFLLHPVLSKWMKKIVPNKVADYMSLSICATLGILPFTASFFSQLNLLAVFANLIIVPMFAIVYPVLFIFVLFALLMPFLRKLFAVLDWFVMAIKSIAAFFAQTALQIRLYPFDVSVSLIFFVLMFIVSPFLMIGSMLKFLFFSGMSILLVIAIIVSYFPFRKGTMVSYLSLSSECIILQNSQQETLFFCNESMNTYGYQSLERFLYVHKYRTMDYVLLPYKPEKRETEFWGSYEVKNMLALDITSQVSAGEISKNTWFSLGNFEILVQEIEQSYIGTEIHFDDISIYFASPEELEYTKLDYVESYLADLRPELLFVGGNDSIGRYGKLSIASQSGQDIDLSYQCDGNLQLVWQNQKWKYGVID